MTQFVDELKDRLEPLRRGDLDTLLEAIALLFQPVEDLARDADDGAPGWSGILDAARVAADQLPWLAQFVGARYPRQAGETDAAFLARIVPLVMAKTVLQRGTVPATIADVKETLTGAKQVYFVERPGTAWRTTVSTLTAETPNPAATLAALLKHKPGGIILTHTLITGGTFSDLQATHTDFNDIQSTYTDLNLVLSNPTL